MTDFSSDSDLDRHPDPTVQALREALARPARFDSRSYDPRKPRLRAAAAEARRTTRTCDGSPETPAETRFFDLRESGYDGPIDQDGYPVTDPDTLSIFAALDRATERQMRHQQAAHEADAGPDAARWTPDLIDEDDF